jgi:hypothetical protein
MEDAEDTLNHRPAHNNLETTPLPADGVELVTSYVSGTTLPGFIATCDLNHLRKELGEIIKLDQRWQSRLDKLCRDISGHVDFLPPEMFEQHIADLANAIGPTMAELQIEVMVNYFVHHVKGKLDEAWNSLVLETVALGSVTEVDFESGDIRWPTLPAETVEKLVKPLIVQMKKRLRVVGPGRLKGTGLFKDIDDFHIALWDVFGGFSRKPSETEVIELLRQHQLCQRKTSNAPLENQTRTLRGWLKKSGFKDFHDAWRKYRLSEKNGK